jgi:hypothetical protein
MLRLHEPDRPGSTVYQQRAAATAATLKAAMDAHGVSANCEDAAAWMARACELAPMEFARHVHACSAVNFAKKMAAIG